MNNSEKSDVLVPFLLKIGLPSGPFIKILGSPFDLGTVNFLLINFVIRYHMYCQNECKMYIDRVLLSS